MTKINKQAIVNYTPAQMYNLVSDINNYKSYLPWCYASSIEQVDGEFITARVDLEYLKVKTFFITTNQNILNTKIIMKLKDGPFKSLDGVWSFNALGDVGCKIEFSLDYQFSNIVLEKLIGPVFNIVTSNIMECFIKEAKKRYGS